MRSIRTSTPPEYVEGDNVIVTPRGGGTPFAAVILKDVGTDIVEIRASGTRHFPYRVQVTRAASHLSANEAPQVANAAYRGVMNERIDRSKQ